MRIHSLLVGIVLTISGVFSQTYSGNFHVGGNSSNYYPVLFSVSGVSGTSSLGKLSLFRSEVHSDGSWAGTFHSDIEFIPSVWGNMSTKIASFTYITGSGTPYNDPIADIIDGSTGSGGCQLIIWLKGGASYSWSATNNSVVSLTDANTDGVTKTSTSGQALNIRTDQSPLVLKAKNMKHHQNVGLSTDVNGYFGGYVGIGTTTPLAPLDVKVATNQHVQILPNTNGAYPNTVGIVSINDANTAYTPLGFYASNYYFGNGKVGIGTTTPDEALTVKGKIHTNEVIIDMKDPIADYVFHPTYKLMPLPDVEQYVKTNSHLPEIPSASEVAKNGMSMGEMQNKLLQKVEELTLYVIEQQKKIEAQTAQIQDLQKRIK
jgi:hypothetical protein